MIYWLLANIFELKHFLNAQNRLNGSIRLCKSRRGSFRVFAKPFSPKYFKACGAFNSKTQIDTKTESVLSAQDKVTALDYNLVKGSFIL